MSNRYNESFKRQAVEKALGRPEGTPLAEISDLLGIGHSTPVVTQGLMGTAVGATRQALGGVVTVGVTDVGASVCPNP